MILTSIDRRLGTLSRIVLRSIQIISPKAPTDILKTFVYRSDVFGKPFCSLSQYLMRGASDWSEMQRESIGSAVSGLNHCAHCETAHHEIARAVLYKRTERTFTAESGVDEDARYQAALRFAERLALNPDAVGTGDCLVLRKADVGDTRTIEVVLIVAGFCLINRLANALRFRVPTARDVRLSARVVATFGYRFLSGLPSGMLPRREVSYWENQLFKRYGDRHEFVRSVERWLEALCALDRVALEKDAVTAKEIASMVNRNPERITHSHLGALKRSGCSEDDIFDLILAGCARAGLLRLRSGLRAMRWEPFDGSMIRELTIPPSKPLV